MKYMRNASKIVLYFTSQRLPVHVLRVHLATPASQHQCLQRSCTVESCRLAFMIGHSTQWSSQYRWAAVGRETGRQAGSHVPQRHLARSTQWINHTRIFSRSIIVAGYVLLCVPRPTIILEGQVTTLVWLLRTSLLVLSCQAHVVHQLGALSLLFSSLSHIESFCTLVHRHIVLEITPLSVNCSLILLAHTEIVARPGTTESRFKCRLRKILVLQIKAQHGHEQI